MKRIVLSIAALLSVVAQAQAESCPVVRPVVIQPIAQAMPAKPVVITIDGSFASGKSTIAQIVADRLGYQLLNTGNLYRAVAYVLKNKLGYTEDRLNNLQLADLQPVLDKARLKFNVNKDRVLEIAYDNANILPYLRGDDVNAIVHKLGKNPVIRQALANYLQQFVTGLDLTGRGIVIEAYGAAKSFPAADVKVYLQATPEVRAIRYKDKLVGTQWETTLDHAKEVIARNDDRGQGLDVSSRELPSDAKVIDTSLQTKEQTADAVLALIKK